MQLRDLALAAIHAYITCTMHNEHNRREVLIGVAAFVAAAPAILRVTSIMPVKVWRPEPTIEWLPGEELPDDWGIRGIELSPEWALDRAFEEYWTSQSEELGSQYRKETMERLRAGWPDADAQARRDAKARRDAERIARGDVGR